MVDKFFLKFALIFLQFLPFFLQFLLDLRYKTAFPCFIVQFSLRYRDCENICLLMYRNGRSFEGD